MPTSEELLIADVQEEFKKHRSYFRVARALDISLSKVKSILGDNSPPPIQRREALFGGRGRPEMQKYIRATCHVNDEWDNTDPAVVALRDDYEEGTHIMCKGRDGDIMILYGIPRSKVDPQPGYFTNCSE